MNCRACGGVLGRDCFNEMDCLSVSMYDEQQDRQKANSLEERISRIESILGIALPTPEPMKLNIVIPNSSHEDIDDFPF